MSGQLSLRDFFQIEQSQFGGRAYGWRLWDPRLKTALSVLAMALNVLFAKAWLSGSLLLVAAALAVYSRCPWKLVLLFLLAPAWATLILVLGMAFGFGTQPLVHLGPLTLYKDGLAMGLNASLRVAADVAWAGLLVITTPFTGMLEALRWFRVPRVIVDTLATIYRYVFLLYDEFISMRASAQARGGFSRYSSTASTSGLIAAQIFMRSYDRAGRVWQAMQARGGEGGNGL
jgi:cobalt/nickel transport system permease protein